MASVDSTLAISFIRKRWKGMMERCYGNTPYAIKTYQSRGIKVADEWRNFDAFKSYVLDVIGMPQGPGRVTLDRIDNDGDYRPGNVRWATYTQSNRNSRNNRIISYQGRDMSVAELAELTGMPYALLMDRITRNGWSVEKAVSTPKIENRRRTTEYRSRHEIKVTHNGETRTLSQWAKAYGISLHILWSRHTSGGWDFTEALTTPADKGNTSKRAAARFEYNGRLMTIKELSAATGIKVPTLTYRLLRRRLSMADALLPLQKIRGISVAGSRPSSGCPS